MTSALGGGCGARTDCGWVKSTTIQKAAAIAIAGINTAAAIKIAKQQFDIADRQMKIAEAMNNMLTKYYYPCEIKHLQEACEQEKYEPEYEEQAGRFANSVALQFGKLREQIQAGFNSFCCNSFTYALKELAIEEARAIADAENYGYRYAEARADALNDVRWNRIQNMLNLGRGLGSQQLAFSQAAGKSYSSLGTQVQQSLGGAIERLSYLNNRNMPVQTPNYIPYNGTMSILPDAQVLHRNPYLGGMYNTPGINPQGGFVGFQDTSSQWMNSPLLGSGGYGNDLYSWDYGAGVSGNDESKGGGLLTAVVGGA